MGASVKKFALRGLFVATAVESSPRAGKTRHIGPFWASRASFVPGVALVGVCRASFVSGLVLVGVCWASFFAEEPLEAPCWANLFAEESLKAFMVSVCMCARSPCGRLSSAGDTFRMQFPSRYFKL